MAPRDDILSEIGNIIGRSANEATGTWDYAAVHFTTPDGKMTNMEPFLYEGMRRIDFVDSSTSMQLRRNFLQLREVTRVEGDDYWIKCLAAIRRSDLKFEVLFEFDDQSRWEIHPGNVHDTFNIIIGDAFPEERI